MVSKGKQLERSPNYGYTITTGGAFTLSHKVRSAEMKVLYDPSACGKYLWDPRSHEKLVLMSEQYLGPRQRPLQCTALFSYWKMMPPWSHLLSFSAGKSLSCH
jgi:hypothetical protein